MKGDGDFILIMASAGSGKTYRLTRHFLRVLYEALSEQRPEVVQSVLAATFTRAAAGEIAGRILQRLAEAIDDPGQRKKLCEDLGAGRLSEEECGQMLEAVVRRLHRLRICTLDSFLIRTAQCFAPELGLSSPWTILEELADEELCLEAIDQTLQDAAADPGQFERTLRLLVHLTQSKPGLQLRADLLDRFQRTYEVLMWGQHQAWEVIHPDPAKLLDAAALKRLPAELDADLGPHLPLTKAGRPNVTWGKALKSLCEQLGEADWEKVIGGGLVEKVIDGSEKYCSVEFPEAFSKALRPIAEHAKAALIAELYDRNVATRDLLQAINERYRRTKAQRSAYLFSDFPRLLSGAGIAGGRQIEQFHARIDGRIDHILLDEFQDTSIAQWRLLDPLVEHIRAALPGRGERKAGKSAPRRSFFCVGDVKQTLYGWRDAEPGLLDELLKRWEAEPEDMTHSFRSSQVIIDAVNEVFGSISGNGVLCGEECRAAAARTWARWYKAHTTEHANRPGFARLITCQRFDNARDTQLAAMKLAAERIRQICDALPGQQVAVLVRRKKFISRMIYELGRRGVAAAGEGGNPLTDDPAVCAALSALHLVDHPADTAALYHVGASPLGRLLELAPEGARNEVLERTRRLRLELTDRGIARVLNDWLGGCAASCSPRNFRRFLQLIELAQRFPYDGGDLTPFVRYVWATRVEDAALAAVRVMTIHASKGRQFDVVVLPDLDRPFISGQAPLLCARPSVLEPPQCISNPVSRAEAQLDPRLAEMDLSWRARQIVEELCALYVAMTRAKQGLEMIVCPQTGSARNGTITMPLSAAGVLRAALFGQEPAPESAELWRHASSIMPEATGQPAAATAAPAQTAPAPVEPLRLRLDAAGAGESRNRPVVSPSGLEGGGYINLKNQLGLRGAGAGEGAGGSPLDRGTVIHRWFELVEWLDDAAPTDRQLSEAVRDLALPAEQMKALVEEFRAACGRPGVSRILSRAGYRLEDGGKSLEVWRERPFAVKAPGPDGGGTVIVWGQLDRLVIVRGEGGRAIRAELIDYKTDRVSAGTAALADRVDHYRPQVLAYRQAVARLLGLEEPAIACKLVFTGADAIALVS